MLLIGLTGGIGSGKTFISKIINSYKNFKIFDSDFEAKKIIKNNPEVITSIKNNFGPLAYVKNNLNKKYISDVVFSDLKKLKLLNQIVHPKVFEALEIYKTKNSDKIIIIESAILFESGMYINNDINILVVSPVELRLDRITKRDNITREKAMQIINSQWKDSKKINLADFIIENINKLETEKVLKNLIKDILSKYEKN
tara:strand:- start:832 stop:1428 length:597 start_codon:yes stop_codon:yes gene_type:complete